MRTIVKREISILAAILVPVLFASCLPGGTTNDGKWKTIPPNGSPTAPGEGGFTANLPAGFIQPADEAGRKLIKDYGAVFVARGGSIPPKTVVFRDEAEVNAFQSNAGKTTETLGGVTIELQSPAMKALKVAADEAVREGLTITPRGADAASRTYKDTVGLWTSRVEPGLTHWSAKGRITPTDAERIRSLAPYDQVAEIFKLESEGIYFSKDLSKSIVYSVAPPGSSQHLSMLAVDISEYDNSKVRAILAKNGWFQTVISDLPHFTFLGAPESELPGLGLKKVTDGGRAYWVPAL